MIWERWKDKETSECQGEGSGNQPWMVSTGRRKRVHREMVVQRQVREETDRRSQSVIDAVG